MKHLTPREIVAELDRHIVGQNAAKRAVAIALRNRWRRKQAPENLRGEITPKNILMIGPTGVGKTEVSRRLARLANAPFLKVEATKFTEVGYVGRDVEQIVRDLVEAAVGMIREQKRAGVDKAARDKAEERLLDALVGAEAQSSTREVFRRKLRAGELDDKEVDLDFADTNNPMQMLDLPGQGGSMSMINLGDMLGKAMGGRTRRVRTTVREAAKPLVTEEADKLVDEEQIVREAIMAVEEDGIVFLDEIDKIAARKDRGGADVSREGVQRDLLPLIEGTTVSTKRGAVKTDHILFIASGAFHVAKPSDLLPELQGRLPIRVELEPLTRDDLRRILVEPQASLIRQYEALMAAENVTLTFEDGAIDRIADMAEAVNKSIENIGARRLQTILERLLDDISFDAPDKGGETFTITASYVDEKVGSLAGNADLSKFIL
ncbi:heat shock protein HslVU, ATPase subunit HslU [Hyphomonas neptunium ATCC 15444]|uniref:ATP-dependent protease ATPase subunit HslU n=2 Tax=Hyphomonas TaxID=85 RepID=HSLU_HYPNA|nr:MULTISPECIES: ATP-dependent protease ATPase subunit HslU [Hyphomonas]Q0C0L1.1 RecName: Full=ATP-dependent protease ATPase subunit HslU; AltName: Full=Unfoldase HslU [Hyphomonas neptunium ATCC 15444]ABI78629.1 heat shock protein HslVU, ATPase subunit HslU [Hyphomonas neptunium ATCC 15444]KCZ83998.1 ATP-dependent protease ATP-binding subunit HslU [Hyphomonas hirschiana VP5]